MVVIDTSANTTKLADRMAEDVTTERVRFWWLGQAGFAFKYGNTLLLIDAYLSDSLAEKYRGREFPHVRMMPAPLEPEEVPGCDFYVCTHAHTDHMDGETISRIQRRSSPRFVVPRAECAKAHDRSVPEARMSCLNAGEVLPLSGSIKLSAVASAHEDFETDDDGNHRFLGYVLDFGGLRIYHSGDTVPYEGLAKRLHSHDVTVAFLPINGRDEYRKGRGVPGNMSVREAAELCVDAGIPNLVGHHFGLFEFNTVGRQQASQELRNYDSDLRWMLPEIGVTYRIDSQIGPV
jgi:L-ascorbate metabolism protein UlaG (beta-lactamase superfamily)